MELADENFIEFNVGARRHPTFHLGRVKSGEIFLLHSKECKDRGFDLRTCPYSLACDNTEPHETNIPTEGTFVAGVGDGILISLRRWTGK